MGFRPQEILLSPTTACNLNCPHCDTPKSTRTLAIAPTLRFLSDCKKNKIRKVGFTGGEPFLAFDFLCAVVKRSVKEGMYFNRIMTNGVWYNNTSQLRACLVKLRNAGYDGSICVSVDAFHVQDLRKVARFIRLVTSIWKRADAASVASVIGARDRLTKEKLLRLARMLNGRLIGYAGASPCIKNGHLFIKILKIGLSAVGKGAVLKNGWDGKWFVEDRCEGPGNVLYVLPDGSVKPCCGYASDSNVLTIGNIRRDSCGEIMDNVRKNSFVNAVFNRGLASIRKKMEHSGIKLPGKTSNNCFFCHYLLTKWPKHLYLAFLILCFVLLTTCASAQNDRHYDQQSQDKDVAIRPGLVSEEISPGVKVVVPQGAQAYKVNENLTVLESAEEYAARKFVTVEDRLDKLEKENGALRKQLNHLKKHLRYIKSRLRSR